MSDLGADARPSGIPPPRFLPLLLQPARPSQDAEPARRPSTRSHASLQPFQTEEESPGLHSVYIVHSFHVSERNYPRRGPRNPTLPSGGLCFHFLSDQIAHEPQVRTIRLQGPGPAPDHSLMLRSLGIGCRRQNSSYYRPLQILGMLATCLSLEHGGLTLPSRYSIDWSRFIAR